MEESRVPTSVMSFHSSTMVYILDLFILKSLSFLEKTGVELDLS